MNDTFRKIVFLALLGSIVFILFILAAAWAIHLYPPAVWAPLALAGRYERLCGPWQAFRGTSVHYRQLSQIGELKAAVRLVEKKDGFDLWHSPLGQFWVPSDTAPVLLTLLAQQAVDIYGKVRPGDVVLDCGAHIGLFTRRALNAGASLVVAIEPGPENLECLRRNFEKEIQERRVVVYPKGVWDKVDLLRFRMVEGNSAGDSFVIDNGPGKFLDIPVTTIDNLVAELQLSRVSLIKMDIKGAERRALLGAAGTLARHKPRIAVASEHLPDDVTAIPQTVLRARADYAVRCGSCFLENFRITPEILFLE